jgi:adenylate cyclase
MSETRSVPAHYPRLNRLIEAMDRPLLALAGIAMVLELLDLHGVSNWWAARTIAVLTLVIDVIFALDVAFKFVVQRSAYTESPWFLIDLMSALPLLDTLAGGVAGLRSIRFVRGFRVLRVFRGLRVLRALRRIPAFDQITREFEGRSKAHRAMNLGIFLLTVVMLMAIVVMRRSMEKEYIARIDSALAEDVSVARLKDLGGSLIRPDAPVVLIRTASVNHNLHDVYFDLRPIDRAVEQFEFFLTLGMMFSMIMFMYIMAYHQIDVTRAQLRGLLNLALPKQVAEQFESDMTAYTRKCRMPATVMFMDFVGFTRTCETLAHDPDLLSKHLEAAMDRVVGELTRHDMIIDKFIGDAVMSFRGGPLVQGTASDHARCAVHAALDSVAAVASLSDLYFHKVKIGGASDLDCLIGAFGTSARLTYTILGDGVNLAARLEPASAQCGTQNLFDEATHQLCAGYEAFLWRRWGRIKVAGKAESIQVYEAFDSQRVNDHAFIHSFHLALDAFEHHDFYRAHDLFRLADSERPGGDEPSRFYARHAEAILLSGRPVGWEPVFEMHK